MQDMNRIKELLELVKNNPIKNEVRRKTFMDVTRYPHYENVVSNLLAFFFDDSEEHGMGSLWFDSLLSLRGISASESNIIVKREYYTTKGNRIDLLIESDNYAVCIENKIYADLSNDLQDYMNTVNWLYAGKNQEIVLLVLSPKLLPKYPLYESFVNITYPELFNAVKSRIGRCMDKCDNTWLLYMKDFMATVETICGGNRMNTEYESLFRDYYSEIKSLEELKSNYIKSMKENVCIVNEALLENSSKIIASEGINVVIWNSPHEGKSETRVSVVIDIFADVEKKRCLTVETSLDCWGWHVALMPRSGTKDMLMSILSIDMFHEQKHPAQDRDGTLKKQFYDCQHIVRNIYGHISVENLANEIISVTNDVIRYIAKCSK